MTLLGADQLLIMVLSVMIKFGGTIRINRGALWTWYFLLCANKRTQIQTTTFNKNRAYSGVLRSHSRHGQCVPPPGRPPVSPRLF